MDKLSVFLDNNPLPPVKGVEEMVQAANAEVKVRDIFFNHNLETNLVEIRVGPPCRIGQRKYPALQGTFVMPWDCA